MARPYSRSNQPKSALVAEYLEQQAEEAMQALVAACAFIAVADGQVQLVERDELLNFVNREGLVPPTSRCDIGEMFDSRVRELESARSFLPQAAWFFRITGKKYFVLYRSQAKNISYSTSGSLVFPDHRQKIFRTLPITGMVAR